MEKFNLRSKKGLMKKGRERFMTIKGKLLLILGTFCLIILAMTGITYVRGSSKLIQGLSKMKSWILNLYPFILFKICLNFILKG